MPRHSSSSSRSHRKKHSKKYRRHSSSSSSSSDSSSERHHSRRRRGHHSHRSRSPRPRSSSPVKKVFMNVQIQILKAKPIQSTSSAETIKEYRAQHNIFIRSQHVNVPDPIMRFEDVQCFPQILMDLLLKAGFKGPTAIQAQGWSIALTGHDLIGIAQTGSGKTLAFLLPAIVHILAQARSHDAKCLILAPTRELTLQIYEQFQKFSVGSQLYAACLYGGQDRYIQKSQLRKGPQVLIACPGLYHPQIADRMLDMGFEPQIRKVVDQIRPQRQTMLFSATWPKEVQKLALDFCKQEPVHIQIGNVELTSNKMIKQIVYVMKAIEKNQRYNQTIDDHQYLCYLNILRLLYLLKDIAHKKILIFCSTKKGCDQLQKTLDREGIRCLALHGDKKQSERDYVMSHFRNGRSTALIATDVASRGLDIKDIEIVVNYDMPKVIEDYVHRIGRTGRAGANGQSISFFASDEDARMAKDLVEILRESQNDIPYELRSLVDQNNKGNNYNPYRRWNSSGSRHIQQPFMQHQHQNQNQNQHPHPHQHQLQHQPSHYPSSWSFQTFNPQFLQQINPYQI
ncbi:unnamed protein product (macronuclear) [Paramecium tetraurelia]|uniref:RNA helicase n=1 Tax=Paramecium tetraurelia TaxID=5888 RepID=A0DS20_PARTE|nr:uncharacterized protein GSPATT00019541001 [Paramecium tetraurelia]CAK85837.1 unnamed protein product [Paramecium tetraurelia]|eukprot:XP_001453234.1 hypothetical protein (macronuclear) [Paramecium tetraurelia strain d4-2]